MPSIFSNHDRLGVSPFRSETGFSCPDAVKYLYGFLNASISVFLSLTCHYIHLFRFNTKPFLWDVVIRDEHVPIKDEVTARTSKTLSLFLTFTEVLRER